jgi:uncharacterized membrane protein YdfJ with MMPL/SSD domain
VEAWVPLFLFSVLFGLSMDYQVFLLSRVHEATPRPAARGGVVFGGGSIGRIITGAAGIIVVVFCGFAAGDLVMFPADGLGRGRLAAAGRHRGARTSTQNPGREAGVSST